MRRHLWREVRRQLAEVRGAGLLAVCLFALGGGWGLLLASAIQWGQATAEDLRGKSFLACVVRSEADAQSLLGSLKAAFGALEARALNPSQLAAELGPWLGQLEVEGLLPPVLELEAPAERAGEIQRWLAGRPEVTVVRSSSEWTAAAAQALARALRLVALVAAVLIAAFTGLVVLAVRVLVLSHADEIAIMRLIGAQEGDIRAPYVVVHALLGLLGGAGAVGLALGTRVFLQPYLPLPALPSWAFPAVVLGGVAVGAVAAFIGVRTLPEEP